MPICTALMHTDCVVRGQYDLRNTQYAIRNTRRGFTFTELVVVVLIVSLFVLLAVMDFSGLLSRNTFRVQANEFVSTMQMAASAAAESDKRYEVIIDIAEQSYTLRQITSPQLPSDVLEEEIIVKNDFSDNCRVVYVLFDDLVSTDEEHQKAFFRAGHSGWQAGGKIVLLDEDEQPYSVVVNRLSRIVTLREGDVELLMPRRQDEVPF
jgi:prepilin-type N-terminal cleavage/methylation domain-containing protein